MKALIISLILSVGVSPLAAQDAPVHDDPDSQQVLVSQAVQELDLALDAYFDLIDQRSVIRFTEAVAHCAKGRLLLEQYLGDDIDNWSPELAMQNPTRMQLALIAAYAERFASENAVEMFRQDSASDAFSDAKQQLAEWDVMMQGAKSRHLASN